MGPALAGVGWAVHRPARRLGILRGMTRNSCPWPHLNSDPISHPRAPVTTPVRTVETYEQWLRRFLRFHRLRHPREMGSAEVNAFLTHLAVEGQVSASTQNQALSALLFLYRELLERDLDLEGVVRARTRPRLPWWRTCCMGEGFA